MRAPVVLVVLDGFGIGDGGAAEILGVRPTTLADRIRKFDIRKPGRRRQ